VQKIIDTLPKDLDDAYLNILRELDERTPDIKTIVQMAVHWLSGALRSMTISQVIDAVRIELGHNPPLSLNDNLTIVCEEDMLYVCGNLVQLDKRTRDLGLSHSTVRVSV
jgi:hypothetical protein